MISLIDLWLPILLSMAFVFVVISLFCGYTASIGLTSEASAMTVFRLIFIPALLGYAISSVQNSIWKGVCWLITLKFIFDGTVYAAVTAGTFAWLWPAP